MLINFVLYFIVNVSYKEAAGLFGLVGLYSTELSELTELFGLQCGEGECSAGEGEHSAGEGGRGPGVPNTNGGIGNDTTGARGFVPNPGLRRGSSNCTIGR